MPSASLIVPASGYASEHRRPGRFRASRVCSLVAAILMGPLKGLSDFDQAFYLEHVHFEP